MLEAEPNPSCVCVCLWQYLISARPWHHSEKTFRPVSEAGKSLWHMVSFPGARKMRWCWPRYCSFFKRGEAGLGEGAQFFPELLTLFLKMYLQSLAAEVCV